MIFFSHFDSWKSQIQLYINMLFPVYFYQSHKQAVNELLLKQLLSLWYFWFLFTRQKSHFYVSCFSQFYKKGPTWAKKASKCLKKPSSSLCISVYANVTYTQPSGRVFNLPFCWENYIIIYTCVFLCVYYWRIFFHYIIPLTAAELYIVNLSVLKN